MQEEGGLAGFYSLKVDEFKNVGFGWTGLRVWRGERREGSGGEEEGERVGSAASEFIALFFC